MNSGDLNKVWEIRALKRKPKDDEARNILEKIAAQVQPIMRKHKWRVKLLSEMCPSNGALLGLNVGAGVNVKLRLRRVNRDEEFIPFDQVLDTMLHELCHNAHGPHNASFYKLWDELRKECEELVNKGIRGSGQGFDLPGRRLGGLTRQPPLSSLRHTALSAAEKRVQLASLLPSGPKRLGGDSCMMAALSPVQAAAMAAERRLRDNIWCASEFYDASEDEANENNDESPISMVQGSGNSRGCSSSHSQSSNVLSLKRKCPSNKMISCLPKTGNKDSIFLDVEMDFSRSQSMLHHDGASSKRIHHIDNLHAPPSKSRSEPRVADFSNSTSSSTSDGNHDHTTSVEESTLWECRMCTFLNSPLLRMCEVCNSQKPKDDGGMQKLWSCKFCTLDNVVSSERCAACGEWRYSHGPPVASLAPNRGT